MVFVQTILMQSVTMRYDKHYANTSGLTFTNSLVRTGEKALKAKCTAPSQIREQKVHT